MRQATLALLIGLLHGPLAADTSRPQTPDLTIRIHAFIVENYLVAEVTAKPLSAGATDVD